MRTLVFALAILAAAPAGAAVVESVPTGFVSENKAQIAKPPADVWAALVQWARWWDGAHGWSGSAANFTLDPKAGGALKESWEGGSTLHATVLMAVPGRSLRLSGGFGPLQALPVLAVMDFSLKPDGAGTLLTMRYAVGGPPQTKLPELAGPVDMVMSHGFQRLVRFVNTGKPEETR